jgi:hypothetical protein
MTDSWNSLEVGCRDEENMDINTAMKRYGGILNLVLYVKSLDFRRFEGEQAVLLIMDYLC